ncbi:bacterial pre-peptidase C-terminal domain protein [Lysobacter antibioticus]|uniref:Bacterial pre-peptidase C-terminal domain protein n=1 Tax=Lysobacter antibioticus TaxID=84531 RepID=A0A0S2F556_LYSAN|nr:bacterial pre-peptidase C-terminal domain protein [Lysobacter antibioticus]
MRVNAAAVSEQVSEIEADLDGRRVTLVLESARNTDSGSLIWVGHVRETSKRRKMTGREVAHDSLNSVILVRRGNTVTGTVSMDGRPFSIRPLPNGQHAVAEMEESPPVRDDVLIPSSPSPRPSGQSSGIRPAPSSVNPQSTGYAGPGPAALEVGEEVTVRVMVVVTKDAKEAIAAAGGDIRSDVEAGIANANLAYINSKVGMTLDLANILEVNYLTENPNLDLDRAIKRGDGYMDEIHTARDANAADIVLFINNSDGWAGFVNKLRPDESEAFAFIGKSNILNMSTIAHEIGHLMGAAHDEFTGNNDKQYSYGQGYCTPDDRFYTIMSYGICSGFKNGRKQLRYFSSPELTFDGVTLGTVDLHDNRRVLIENKRRVAAFRADPASANLRPAADFSFSRDTSGDYPNPNRLRFTDSSVDPDGSIVSRYWGFGDHATSAEANPAHNFLDGTWNVTLVVTDNKGAMSTVTKTITLPDLGAANSPPTADFSFTSNGLTTTFSDRSIDRDGSIASRNWSFGDGATATATSPTRTYAKAGTYSVALTVTDDKGAAHTVTKSVVVSAPVSPTGTLSNGIPVDGISGASGSYRSWTLVVPPGASKLRFATSGYSGDADLYVKYGSAPTTSSYDCRANLGSGAETCNIPTAQAGTYHVMVNGWSAFSGMRLVGSYEEGGADTLANGVAKTGISGAAGSYRFWTMQVPSGASDLQFATSEYSGDADLYVKYGSAPTATHYDCRANLGSTSETCRIAEAKAGAYHVMVNGWSAYSGMRLLGSYRAGSGGSGTSDNTGTGVGILSNGVSVSGISGTAGSYRYWALTVPLGASELEFIASGYRGDADLYIKYGSSPTTTNYDCRANLGSAMEVCRIANVQAGKYYVMVNGWSAFSGMNLIGTYRSR